MENNMANAFNKLERYGGQISIYGDIAKKLVLTALIQQNTVLVRSYWVLESKKNTNPSQVFSLICLKSSQRKQFMFTTKSENTLQKSIWVEFGRETVNPLYYWQKRFEVLWSSNQTSFGVVSRGYSGNLSVHVAARVGDSLWNF